MCYANYFEKIKFRLIIKKRNLSKNIPAVWGLYVSVNSRMNFQGTSEVFNGLSLETLIKKLCKFIPYPSADR